MAWPNDEGARRGFLAASYANMIGLNRSRQCGEQANTIIQGWLEDVGGLGTPVDAPALPYQKWAIWQKMGQRLAAGFILAAIHKMARHHPDLRGGASVNKATQLIEGKGAWGLPQDRRQLMDAWSTCKDVAHLCVYLCFASQKLYKVGDTSDWFYLFTIRMRNDLPRLLSTARYYQEFGLTHHAK